MNTKFSTINRVIACVAPYRGDDSPISVRLGSEDAAGPVPTAFNKIVDIVRNSQTEDESRASVVRALTRSFPNDLQEHISNLRDVRSISRCIYTCMKRSS